MKFGEKLKKLRTTQGMRQIDVANAVGISLRAYAGYENNNRYPKHREVYQKLAVALGCDLNYLLAEDEVFISEAGEQYGSRGRRQAAQLVTELSGMFAGGELSDEDKDAVMIALQRAYFDCKLDNKKYTPKKFQK